MGRAAIRLPDARAAIALERRPPRRSAATPRFRATRAGEASSPVLPRKHFTLGQSRLSGNYVFNSHRRPEPRMEDRTPACKDKTSVRSGLTDPCDVPVKGG